MRMQTLPSIYLPLFRSARPHRLLRRRPRRPLEDVPRARLPPRGRAGAQHPVAARGRRHPGELKVPGIKHTSHNME